MGRSWALSPTEHDFGAVPVLVVLTLVNMGFVSVSFHKASGFNPRSFTINSLLVWLPKPSHVVVGCQLPSSFVYVRVCPRLFLCSYVPRRCATVRPCGR